MYVETAGSPISVSSPSSGSPSTPRPRSSPSRLRIRAASSAAALRVNVSPRISSGRTSPLATSHTTRPDMVSVLPDPAPATTSIGSIGASMIVACCGVGGGWPSAAARATAENLTR